MCIKVQGQSLSAAVKTTDASSSKGGKKIKDFVGCQLSRKLKPKASAVAAAEHLVLCGGAQYSRKLRLQMSIHLTSCNFVSLRGTVEDKLEKKPGENSTDSPSANSARSSRQSSECGKTKASLSVITAYQ